MFPFLAVRRCLHHGTKEFPCYRGDLLAQVIICHRGATPLSRVMFNRWPSKYTTGSWHTMYRVWKGDGKFERGGKETEQRNKFAVWPQPSLNIEIRKIRQLKEQQPLFKDISFLARRWEALFLAGRSARRYRRKMKFKELPDLKGFWEDYSLEVLKMSNWWAFSNILFTPLCTFEHGSA